MSLETVYYIGQTIAVFAILGSLIALILQIRQSNKLARDHAEREQITALKNVYDSFNSDPELTAIYLRGQVDPEQLSELEQVRYGVFIMSFMRQWEGLELQYRKGLIDDEIWETHTAQLRSGASPGVKFVWSKNRTFFSKEFQLFLDKQMAKAEQELGDVQASQVQSAGALKGLK